MKKVIDFLFELVKILMSILVITFILFKFFIFPCNVVGTSMYPTLHDSDRGYSFVITKNIKIDRFDICVIDVTSNDEETKRIVKRVIGLPNETITYIDNKLYIDDVYYDEDYLGDVTTDDFSITLEDDEYFCLGDNRNNSRDSRHYGTFSKEQFISTKMFIFYPFSNFGVKK